jgi:AcrR family transcriptional regulator
MPRTRAFDDASVAAAALAVFWERGYVATSLAMLQDATGLSKSSLYESYGSKRGLFDRAMSDYLDRIISPLFAPLEARGAGRTDVLAYFASFERLFRTRGPVARRGCFMLNTATELNELDGAAEQRVRDYRLRMQHAFVNALGGAALAPVEADALADRLTATHIGLMITSRVDLEAAAALAATIIRDLEATLPR